MVNNYTTSFTCIWHCTCSCVLSAPGPQACTANAIKGVYSNYSLLDASGNTDGCETEGEPVCFTEEIRSVEEWSSGGSIVALALHSTAGRKH